ncbi:6,7-dimethyl-8-ribityllumazine synthase [Dysgonomonas sp. Marseille-P4677]|uniref:6,7-dimethyl-8-ribityllumazine synthase n=1 Tax=Dysgonomonas sp. Marseille-P4677 TaxID=2364790 RepID=UPI0019146CEB|nr:6,7-dimethyl-8-ribityllumazine synthase [Dysgonomonas sp. Marseille-P4677]MBK5721561.1 6,7-dimethyl-8-ribityllumazine synthase [Dysgonomonas sp. Marseille-P4677]
MATAYHNLSSYDPEKVPDGTDMKIGIVVSEWNDNITGSLLAAAHKTLIKHGVKEENILIDFVPGSFELIFGAKHMVENKGIDAVIALGCVIKGDTPHFDYVCSGVTQGIADMNIRYDIPFIFGLLTTDNAQQAEDRSGGRHGNKGDECAITALKMVDFYRRNLEE